MFYYFSKMAPTGYSLTFNVDIKKLKDTLRQAKLKFFPAYLYLVTKCINKTIEFRIALNDGVLGYYDYLTPLYASFHEDDRTFSHENTQGSCLLLRRRMNCVKSCIISDKVV